MLYKIREKGIIIKGAKNSSLLNKLREGVVRW